MKFISKKISALALMGLMAGSVFAADNVKELGATKATSDYFWKFRPLKKDEVASDKKVTDPRVVFRFFEDDYTPGGFDYWYPDASKIKLPEESGYESEVAIEFDLVASDYSGGAVVLYNMLYNMESYVSKGALEFYIKGEKGGEVATVGLVDDETRDGAKTATRLPISDYMKITKEWQKVSIPLADFGLRGVYWDEKKRVEVPMKFDWNAVVEFRIEIKKGDNESFKVWVDDIFVLRDVFGEKELVYEESWNEKYGKDVIPAPPLGTEPQANAIYKLFDNDVPNGGFAYTYGGKTGWAVQPTDKTGVKALGFYPDNSEYSGITLSLGAGKGVNLVKYRRKHEGKYAGIGFWLKAAPKVKSIYLGLLDDDSDGYKTQTKLTLGDYGDITEEWTYFMVPVKAFSTKGLYWDPEKKAEISAPILWENIEEFRFSTSKYENKVGDNDPVPFWIADMKVIDHMPGYVDKEEFWAKFSSDSPDRMLLDVESEVGQKWETGHGPKSKMEWKIVDSENPELGKKSVEFDFAMSDWADGIYSFKKNDSPAEIRDWTRHWALRFWIYTDKPYQSITVQIGDSGSELWVANTGGTRGWTEVLLPFENFNKFPYYQPPHAEQNGNFDLQSVVDIDFKPAGEGSHGTFRIDNIQLTNLKELDKPPAPEEVNVAAVIDAGKVIHEKINPGIFGINVALWDGDLLNDQTIKYVKDVDHGVLRYPGGLRADEDHWFEVLEKQDWMVDTDEIVDFAKSTETGLMITVNGGRGTAEQAADWVEHVNIKRKANVKYWEIGNELYGNWHPNQMTGEAYGKMCADYAQKMKAVDPTIFITAVWTLHGPWNEAVFKHCAPYVDGVNVHHYPQHYGEENDVALLDAPNSVLHLMPHVQAKTKEYGVPGKHYEVWLTEWNSVDFNPGPQTMSYINGLFVVDYLGKLATVNIEQASYWDVHNSITEQGGDYGYLSRVGAPDGDNIPRPSYWGFKMASDALRGKFLGCETDNYDVTCYATENEKGEKWLMMVNKMAETKAVVDVKGLSGQAVRRELTEGNFAKGWEEVDVDLGKGVTLPAHSATAFRLK